MNMSNENMLKSQENRNENQSENELESVPKPSRIVKRRACEPFSNKSFTDWVITPFPFETL